MKKAVMYGAGNIGRGFIGQLLSQSGYEVVFLDINKTVIDCLNADRSYPLRLISPGGWQEETVQNVRGVNSMDAGLAAEEIATADVMATAVGANILPRIAPVVAKGLALRWQQGNMVPLDIIICENLLHADKYFKGLLEENLDKQLHGLLEEKVGLVEASIGRMVPVATAEMQQGNPLRVWAEPYCELPVDKMAFKGPVPGIVGIKPFAPFEFFIERKLFMHNMSHAVLAYMGRLAGCEFIWQAVRNEKIAKVVRGALAESGRALSQKHNVPLEELEAFSADLMVRFDNPMLGDTVARVGRDPIRKLEKHDRLAGALFLCIDQNVKPAYISAGIAAALRFEEPGDEASLKVRETVKKKGVEKALKTYCAITKHNQAYWWILEFYKNFAKGILSE